MSDVSILIVEDEDNIALALTHVLRREGYKVERVAVGNAAVPAIRESRPDLVLLDVMLPEVSGYEICQSVRMDSDISGTKILIMTARGTDVERRKGLALGADGFITKPFELSDLKQQVAQCLSGGGA